MNILRDKKLTFKIIYIYYLNEIEPMYKNSFQRLIVTTNN